jgi:hypothetical protein
LGEEIRESIRAFFAEPERVRAEYLAARTRDELRADDQGAVDDEGSWITVPLAFPGISISPTSVLL